MTKLLCSGKILQIVVVGEYLNLVSHAFKVHLPLLEGIMYCEELFVVDIVVELGSDHCMCMESNGT